LLLWKDFSFTGTNKNITNISLTIGTLISSNGLIQTYGLFLDKDGLFSRTPKAHKQLETILSTLTTILQAITMCLCVTFLKETPIPIVIFLVIFIIIVMLNFILAPRDKS